MRFWKSLYILALAVLLAACQPSQATGPAATVAATATVIATATPAPTTTVAPSATPAPTSTDTPVPTSTPAPTDTPAPTATQAPTATTPPTAAPTATHAPAPAPTARPATKPPASHEAYVKEIAPYAQAEQADSGVPASFSIALAANETGWGVSVLSNTYHNYHGISCGKPNEGLPCVTYGGGQWNQYSSPEAGFIWAGRWLKRRSTFAAAFEHTDDVAAFTREVLKCYISCSVPFPQKMYDGTMQMIEQYNLTQYDKPKP